MTKVGAKRVRTCIGCNKQSDKFDLHRIVKLADGGVAYDETGRLSGRGAYVCSIECFEQACARGRVARALKTKVGKEEAAAIASALEKALASAAAR